MPFDLSHDINYIYYFCLLQLAEYNKTTRRYDTITYKSISELTERIRTYCAVSETTISRFLRQMESNQYKEYLTIDRK